MKSIIWALAASGLYLLLQGCSPAPLFPNNSSPELQREQFGVLVAKPDVYRGQAVKMAGRVVGVESTKRGTIILAEWIPYPEEGQYGPGSNRFNSQDRFTFLYPGIIDPQSAWQGNRFVMTGEMEGTQDVIAGFSGTSKSVPFMVARCIHIWEVGDNLWWDQPDTEPGGYPYLQQTYCAKS